jgi:hypothetical protein
MDRVLPYYLLKERRQKLGFEGEDLENQKRAAIIRNSQSITADDIEYQGHGCHGAESADATSMYLVKAASRPGYRYEVDVLHILAPVATTLSYSSANTYMLFKSSFLCLIFLHLHSSTIFKFPLEVNFKPLQYQK